MEKVVFKLEILDDITKKKAMKSVSSLSGVDSIALNMKDKRMTIVGEIDPVALAAILRKLCHVDILNVGPTKWLEKKKEDDIRPKNELVKVVPGDTYCGLNTSINLQISKRVFELIRSEYNLVLGGMIISELDDSKELPREEKNWYNGGGGLDKDNGGKRKFVPKVGVTWIKRMVATPWFRRKKLEVHNEKDKKKAMKTVSGLSGVDSVAMDMKGKGKELTITGDIDPVTAVAKLRKERVEIGDIYSWLNTSGKRQIVMEKVVFKLEILDDITKKKAMKSVSSLSGVDSIALNMKDKRMTIVGEIDPVALAAILRKLCHVDILNVGPTKWLEKKKEDDIRPKNELVKVVPGDTYCGLNTSINLQVDLDSDSDSDSDSETPSLCASLTLSPCADVCFCLSACLSSW